MTFDLRPHDPAHHAAWRVLLAEPSIALQYDAFQGDGGLAHKLADPHLRPETIRFAFDGEAMVGFAFAWVLGSGEAAWGILRVAVHPSHRRRGLGRTLAREVSAAVTALGVRDHYTSVWQPAEDGEAFAGSMGYTHARWFWMMERARGAVPSPAWPAGITVRVFDRSEAMLRDWNDAYNGSFIDHWHYVPSSLENARRISEAPDFPADGLALAYRGTEPVGFCRCELYPTRGEIGVLGTTRAARGIGLGRALLRWGVDWLESHTTTPVTLLVDGDNERALSLYRSEGFEVRRTRRVLQETAAR